MDMKNRYVKEAIAFLGEKYFSSLDITFLEVAYKGELSVSRHGNKATISYGELVSLFRGLTILKENRNQKTFSVSFHRHFEENGLMHDSSRNGVLNIAQTKKMIMMSALMGLNTFMLYTEDVYEVEGEPYFGYLRGRYTVKEIKEIVQYAEGFGVEVVPCIQTLSHLARALHWNRYAICRESFNTLLTNDPNTYVLIERMISSCAKAFKSKRIHIGMDEAADLGVGRLMYEGKVVDRTEELLTHLNKVVGICKKYNFQPMMWSDMFFKLNSSSQEQYKSKEFLSDRIKKLIPDVDLVHWDYYHDDKSFYDHFFLAHKDTGKKVVFAGGAIRWTGFAPNVSGSLTISRAALESALSNKITSVFVTSWGDNGDESTGVAAFATLALYSLYDYKGGCTDKEVSGLVEAVTGDSLAMWETLEIPNKLRNELLPYEYPSKALFYQDVLLGIYDTKVKDKFATIYRKHAEKLQNAANNSDKFSYIYQNLANFCDFLSVKSVLGKNIRKAYKKKDFATLEEIAHGVIPTAIEKLDTFHESFRTQWMIENKPNGFVVTDGRIGFLKNRLISAQVAIDAYLRKEITKIDELEEVLLDYDGKNDDGPFNGNVWSTIVTVDDIG